MSDPKRVQRKRTKGWRMPENTVSVCRPGKWGNPYAVQPVDRHGLYPYGFRVRPEPSVAAFRQVYNTVPEAAARAVHLYRRDIENSMLGPEVYERITAELAGKNLACWCPLDQPCHADVLLEIANQAAS